MVQNLESIVFELNNWGLADVLLPFLLILIVIFAILQKTRVLGERDGKPKKNMNLGLSVILALMVVIPHILGTYPDGFDIVQILQSALPSISMVIVAVIMALLLIGLFGGEASWVGNKASGFIALLAFLAVTYFFLVSSGVRLPYYFTRISDETITLVIVILIFALLIWFITRDPEEDKTQKEGVFEQIGDLFGKK